VKEHKRPCHIVEETAFSTSGGNSSEMSQDPRSENQPTTPRHPLLQLSKLTTSPPDTGANASAEEAEEGTEDGTSQVIDVVHSFRLNETSFDKKSYLTHLKQYMKKVKETLKERNAPESEITAFEKGAAAYAKKIVANFKDYEFFTGESMDPDAMVVLLNYREDGVTPYVIVWKQGLTEMKV
jgi:hypothetical protein